MVCELDDFDVASFVGIASTFPRDRFGFVVTPNVDHLIRLCDDPSFRALYRCATYTLLDSRVIALLLRLTQGMRLGVCPGSDLTAELLRRVASASDPIVVIGGSDVQIKALRAAYGLANLRHHNPSMGFIGDPVATETCLRFIEAQSPFRFCILAVGSPQQEEIAQQLQSRGTALGLVLCVGASLNFLTGVERRAPPWMQRLALEWLYRLLQDPRRLAHRYLIRGPRIFRYLLSSHLVLRVRNRRSEMPTVGSDRAT